VNPTLTALIVFGCVFGGTLLGMCLRAVTPVHHLSEDSKDVINLGIGLIATLTALVLGLVIATAKSSYDSQELSVKHIAAKFLLLDRELAQYGPETREARDLIRRSLAHKLNEIWPEESKPETDTAKTPPITEGIQERISQLAPRSETQRGLQSRALQVTSDILETRWFVLGALGRSVPLPFLVVVVFWLTIIFGSFGLLAPRNATVVVVLFVCALSVAGAICLILEMDQPFTGLMKISSAPLRYTLAHLGQ